MSLKPSMRIRKRHILFEVISESKIKKNDIIKEILTGMLRFLGELKASELYLWVAEYDEKNKKGILTCSRENLTKVLAALSLINRINNERACIVTLRVSGTIKALKRR